MKKILIVSDTHGDLVSLKKVIKRENPDYIIHAGDYCIDNKEIEKYTDYFVRGNNDFFGKEYDIFLIENVSFFLCHGHNFVNLIANNKKISESICKILQEKNIDIGIFGHTHIEYFKKINDKIIINPGSLILPRNQAKVPTYAIIHIDNEKIIESNINEVIKLNNENY